MDDLRGLLRLRREFPPPERRREIREAAGVSMATVAAALGVSAQTIWKWETSRAEPTPEHLQAYGDVLRLLEEEAPVGA
jgi:transcriptional regulator with XRE-family HTH domain